MVDPKSLTPGTKVGRMRPDGTLATTRLTKRGDIDGYDLGHWQTEEQSDIGCGAKVIADDRLASGIVFVVEEV